MSYLSEVLRTMLGTKYFVITAQMDEQKLVYITYTNKTNESEWLISAHKSAVEKEMECLPAPGQSVCLRRKSD